MRRRCHCRFLSSRHFFMLLRCATDARRRFRRRYDTTCFRRRHFALMLRLMLSPAIDVAPADATFSMLPMMPPPPPPPCRHAFFFDTLL